MTSIETSRKVPEHVGKPGGVLGKQGPACEKERGSKRGEGGDGVEHGWAMAGSFDGDTMCKQVVRKKPLSSDPGLSSSIVLSALSQGELIVRMSEVISFAFKG